MFHRLRSIEKVSLQLVRFFNMIYFCFLIAPYESKMYIRQSHIKEFTTVAKLFLRSHFSLLTRLIPAFF